MILFFAPYPSPSTVKEGFMRRIAAIDALFQDRPRHYVYPAAWWNPAAADGYRIVTNSPEPGVGHELLDFSYTAHHRRLTELVRRSDFVYAHTVHSSQFLLPYYATGKIITDLHGIAPEEECMFGRPHRGQFYEACEEQAVRGSAALVAVTRAMERHYRRKYSGLETPCILLPIHNDRPERAELTRPPRKRYQVVYTGGSQVWQNLDRMMSVVEQCRTPADFHFFSHDREAFAGAASRHGVAGQVTLGFCDPGRLSTMYAGMDLGLVLRDDTAVNRVSCPTKLWEYVASGVVPVLHLAELGDFAELGGRGVHMEDLIAGDIPSADELDEIRRGNAEAFQRLLELVEAGADRVRAFSAITSRIDMQAKASLFLTDYERTHVYPARASYSCTFQHGTALETCRGYWDDVTQAEGSFAVAAHVPGDLVALHVQCMDKPHITAPLQAVISHAGGEETRVTLKGPASCDKYGNWVFGSGLEWASYEGPPLSQIRDIRIEYSILAVGAEAARNLPHPGAAASPAAAGRSALVRALSRGCRKVLPQRWYDRLRGVYRRARGIPENQTQPPIQQAACDAARHVFLLTEPFGDEAAAEATPLSLPPRLESLVRWIARRGYQVTLFQAATDAWRRKAGATQIVGVPLQAGCELAQEVLAAHGAPDLLICCSVAVLPRQGYRNLLGVFDGGVTGGLETLNGNAEKCLSPCHTLVCLDAMAEAAVSRLVPGLAHRVRRLPDEANAADWERALDKILDRHLTARSPGGDAAGGDRDPRWLILNRNAVHGGVESLVREESMGLNAPVVVTGGLDQHATCPFPYIYAGDEPALLKHLRGGDAVLYHYLPDWATAAIKKSGVPAFEFLHRVDTADNDKSVPAGIVTHSDFLKTFVEGRFGGQVAVAPHPIDSELFVPGESLGRWVGGITTYLHLKGLDRFIDAWARVEDRFPEFEAHLWGQGADQPGLQQLTKTLGAGVTLHGPTSAPWKTLRQYRCVVVPSRLEGLPVCILEALAMNIPVLASDLEGMREFNRVAAARGYPEPLVLFRADDPEDLAEKLAGILQSGRRPDTRPYILDHYSRQRHCRVIAGLHDACRPAPASQEAEPSQRDRWLQTYPHLEWFSKEVGIPEANLVQGLEIEKEFHRKILTEADPSKRKRMCAQVYKAVHPLFRCGDPLDIPVEWKLPTVEMFCEELANRSVLDVGCGHGHFLRCIAKHLPHGRLLGIDADIAPQLREEPDIEFREADILSFAVDRPFDVVFSDNVMEHIPPQDVESHLDSVSRAVKPGGLFILIMPNELFGPNDVTRIIDNTYTNRVKALGTHLSESTYSAMVPRLLRHGFGNIRAVAPRQLRDRGLGRISPRWHQMVERNAAIRALLYKYRRNGQSAARLLVRLVARKRETSRVSFARPSRGTLAPRARR